MREANSGLPVSFKVFVKDHGAVSLTVIDTTIPAASYSPFFDSLTHKHNQSFPVGYNPWLPFRLATTQLQFAIYGLPIKAHLDSNDDLCDLLQPSIYNSQSVLISKGRFANPDCRLRLHDEKAFSGVVLTPAEDGKLLSDLSKIQFSVLIISLREPTPCLPPNNVITAGDLVKSNPDARILLSHLRWPPHQIRTPLSKPSMPPGREPQTWSQQLDRLPGTLPQLL